MLSKLSIRAKITSVVALLLVAMAGMGLLAVCNMRAINANTVDIATNWLPSVRALGESARRRHHLPQRDPRAHAGRDHRGQGSRREDPGQAWSKATPKSARHYEPMITSPEERALYNEWSKTWDEYRKGTQEVIALSRKNPGHFPHEAHELNTKTVNKIGHRFRQHPEEGHRPQQLRRRQGDGRRGRQLQLGADDAGGHSWRGHHRRRGRQLLSGPRCLERHLLDREADAGARPGRSFGGNPAPGREDRDRPDGGCAAGVQGSADRQEGRR